MGLGSNKMTTQYKWLPSEPNEQILDAMPQYIRRNALISIYKAMWQAAPTREPLSSDEIDALWVSFCSDLSIDTYADFVRLIEKAHGIGG
jgi:hypothetical protein